MMKMLVFQESPVFFFHCTKKHVALGKIFIFETRSVFFKRFQKIFFFFFKITLKINNKFLKSGHISGNSVIKDLNLAFCYFSNQRKKRIDCRKFYFPERYLKHMITMSHHLADIHFAPFWLQIWFQPKDSFCNFFKTFRFMQTFFHQPFSFLRFSIWAKWWLQCHTYNARECLKS